MQFVKQTRADLVVTDDLHMVWFMWNHSRVSNKIFCLVWISCFTIHIYCRNFQHIHGYRWVVCDFGTNLEQFYTELFQETRKKCSLHRFSNYFRSFGKWEFPSFTFLLKSFRNFKKIARMFIRKNLSVWNSSFHPNISYKWHQK
jgi:hypothetical protein